MGVLDKISEMKRSGMSEDEIISSLQQQGVSPKSINEAINQSKIKRAVSGNEENEKLDPSIKGDVPPPPPEAKSTTYRPGVREASAEHTAPAPGASPVKPAPSSPPMPSEPEEPAGEYYEPAEYSPGDYPQEYPQEGGYGGYESYGYEPYGDYGEPVSSTDTFIEIAEQVFSEKIKEIEKQLEDLGDFKALAQVKLDHALERVKRIETAMDKLQLAILDKIGSYGHSLESIKKEMGMMQDSFGKALPGLAKKPAKRPSIKKPAVQKPQKPRAKKPVARKTTRKKISRKK